MYSPLFLQDWGKAFDKVHRAKAVTGSVKTLNDEYFKRIEAIEFTIKQDDGTLPENLGKADIILVGVDTEGENRYSGFDFLRKELDFASKIYAEKPWMGDVTVVALQCLVLQNASKLSSLLP
ncbi:hypothetical protein DY000_02044075 [Brassica cretica]|uniref:Uncharacterized protein n=1 Tax=Brassica cretica TaxID=69181 RepID=A0ABQ7BFX4_BRACR|nr:hypothetical protein DY000_02044075 [Brassica cretica]